MTEPRWTRDPHVYAALVVGLVLRALPMILWGWSGDDCTRDECIYRIAARPIVAGEGLGLAPAGWLPAPGYPYLLAACQILFGHYEAAKWVQWALTVPTFAVLWNLGQRVGDRATARAMGWLFALHPTLVFFVGTLWTETVYVFLLSSTMLALLWAREGRWTRAVLPGALLGLTVLTRGVATWLAPVLLLGLLVPEAGLAGPWREAVRRRARHAVGFLLALALVVAPYAVSASQRWGGRVISDATVGHVASLGNDDFPPVTFDYAIGQLTGKVYSRTLATGRPSCPRRDGPVAYDRCETQRALEWIAAHPGEFLARVPTRLAQLLNPHSFLTRHLRWNLWPGIPWALKEFLVLFQAAFTVAIVLGGTVGAWARARGAWGVLSVGTVLYHLAVIAGLYGLTRFRLPLEPLWMVYLAQVITRPGDTVGALRASPGRAIGAVVTVALLLPLLGRYAWTGWPWIH